MSSLDRFAFRPTSRSTSSSIGSPWQSHPGTYGANRPLIARYFTITSFRTLFSASPMRMWPLAYGGPSRRTKRRRPALAPSSFSYRRMAAHEGGRVGEPFGHRLLRGRDAAPSPRCPDPFDVFREPASREHVAVERQVRIAREHASRLVHGCGRVVGEVARREVTGLGRAT